MTEFTICPQCGQAQSARAFVYSPSLGTSVCPACRASAAAQALGAAPESRKAARTQMRAAPAKRTVWPIVVALIALVAIADPASMPTVAATAPDPTTQPANILDAPPQEPPTTQGIQLASLPHGPVTDEQIGDAIQHGVDFLLTQFHDGQFHPDGNMNEGQREGTDALCVYALATCSKAIADQRLGPRSAEMNAMIEALKRYALKSSDAIAMRNNGGAFKTPGPLTYTHSLRACALATFNRPQDRKTLQADVDWLIGANTRGSYMYSDAFSPNRNWKQKHRATTQQSSGRGIIESSEAATVFLAKAPYQGPGENVDQQRPRMPTRGGQTIPPPTPGTQSPGANPVPPGSEQPPIMPPFYPPTSMPTYQPPQIDRYDNFVWDNSNSQYGLLGVWAGAEVGIEVPSDYWRIVEQHWTKYQMTDGEWGYSPMDVLGGYSMTCAGIASLLVTHDYLDAPLLGKVFAPQPYSPALQKGLAWLETGDNAADLTRRMHFLGYNLFGMERVGLACGFKYFGEHDWFVELASRALATQQPDGRFKSAGADDVVETAYTLLFLARGRHPIVANKLRFEGSWTNRPRDLANLASYVSHEMERPLNWQVVDAKRSAEDWADAPILYIASQKALKFDDAMAAKLTTFVNNGGIIFSHADAGSPEFTQSVAELAKKMFPAYPLRDLPTEHPLYTLNYKITTPRPRLQGVSNGVRLLWVHSPNELSDAWQTRSTLSRKQAYQLGANLYLYATGKEKFRNRLDSPIIPPPDTAPLRTVTVARLMHAGNWNPEPGAWPRFGRKLQWETGIQLKIAEMPIGELSFAKAPIAHLTGTDALTLSDAEVSACRTFVEAGGTLLIDAAGGSAEFTDSATPWLTKLAAGSPLMSVDPKDRLLHHTIDGTVDVPAKALRLYAFGLLGADVPRIKTAQLGKGRVIFSRCDIATGLLGTDTWGVLGYVPEYSEALVKNIVLTAVQ